jgi:D-alanyl-D-alanine dipeptidase
MIFFTMGQDSKKLNQYGLHVISKKTDYIASSSKPGYKMVDIKQIIPALILDLRYAGKNNFMHARLYPLIHTTYLREKAAMQLDSVQQVLKSKGLGIKIFDAYRPYSVTEKMWLLVQDDRYAADPKKGSGHNRGVAIDLTLVDLKTKKEVEMGTGFDNFSDTAHHQFNHLPEAVLHNRLLLKTLMEQYGFKALDTEWWHYALNNAMEYELLDIPFKDLK